MGILFVFALALQCEGGDQRRRTVERRVPDHGPQCIGVKGRLLTDAGTEASNRLLGRPIGPPDDCSMYRSTFADLNGD